MAQELTHNPRLRVLCSFWYYRKIDMEHWIRTKFDGVVPDIFADSGAFSAYTQNSHVDIDEYIDWVKRWSYLFTAYAGLDVINDPKKTLHNQKYLERQGLNPVPVFHVGDDWEYLEKYLGDYKYIAIGGMAGHSFSNQKNLIRWLVRVFRHVDNRALLHGFGVTSYKIMNMFNWYSLDSTSWLSGANFARLQLWSEGRGRFVNVQMFDKFDVNENSRLIRAYGYTPGQFALREKNKREYTTVISGLSYYRAERYNQRHGLVMPETPLFDPPIDSGRRDPMTYPIDDRRGLRIYLGDIPSSKDLIHLHKAIQDNRV